MGFFDRFKRKPTEPAQPPAVAPAAASSPPAKPAVGRGGKSRAHHYLLAHYAMRFSAFGSPLQFFANMGSPGAEETVAELLETVHLQCKDKEPEAGFTAKDVKTHPRRLNNDRVCVVIEMPPPQAITECYFTAAVLMKRPDPSHLDEKIPVRYITMEFGYGDKPGSVRTVMCEWTEAGAHVNYGDGPEPTVQAFLQAVETMVNRPE